MPICWRSGTCHALLVEVHHGVLARQPPCTPLLAQQLVFRHINCWRLADHLSGAGRAQISRDGLGGYVGGQLLHRCRVEHRQRRRWQLAMGAKICGRVVGICWVRGRIRTLLWATRGDSRVSRWLHKLAAILPALRVIDRRCGRAVASLPDHAPAVDGHHAGPASRHLPAAVDRAARALALNAFQRRAPSICVGDSGGGLGFGAARADLA